MEEMRRVRKFLQLLEEDTQFLGTLYLLFRRRNLYIDYQDILNEAERKLKEECKPKVIYKLRYDPTYRSIFIFFPDFGANSEYEVISVDRIVRILIEDYVEERLQSLQS